MDKLLLLLSTLSRRRHTEENKEKNIKIYYSAPSVPEKKSICAFIEFVGIAGGVAADVIFAMHFCWLCIVFDSSIYTGMLFFLFFIIIIAFSISSSLHYYSFTYSRYCCALFFLSNNIVS